MLDQPASAVDITLLTPSMLKWQAYSVFPKPLVSNGIQFALDLMVFQWSTRELCRRSSRRPLTSPLPTSSLTRRSGPNIVGIACGLTRNVELVIGGTGGFRKVRVAQAKGMGKSGGARVVYIWRNERFPVFLITVFPKNRKENLEMAERNALKKRADSIFSRLTRGSMKTQFEQMMDGLNDVEAFLAGEQEGFKAPCPKKLTSRRSVIG